MKRTLAEMNRIDNSLYFDFIPDELLYIIIVELRNFNLFLSRKYTRVYNAYINNIHRGFLNPFKLNEFNNTQIFEYKKRLPDIVEKSKIKERQRVYKKLPSPINSTSTYWLREYYAQSRTYQFSQSFDYESRRVGFRSPFTHYQSITDDIRYIIYAYFEFFEDKKIINNTLIYISNESNNVLYKIKNINVDFNIRDDEHNTFESYNWKDVWDKLSSEDQNAILHQNGFPLKALKNE